MPDVVSPAVRSRMMSGIRGADTKPELTVRRLLHARGFRYRLHVKGMPGRPDIVLPKHRTVVFVHGCFWHHHPACRYATIPDTRREFWLAKLDGNAARDARDRDAIVALGWRVITVWECEVRRGDIEWLPGAIRGDSPERARHARAAEPGDQRATPR